MDSLPYSQACENNKAAILSVLARVFADSTTVLEIASGTGQHACHFAENMPWLFWQPSDIAQNLAFVEPRCTAYPGDNLLPPICLDVQDRPWPVKIPGAVFTANSLHIMSFAAVEKFFAALRDSPSETVLAVYGPFNYGGEYTSESNARFDQWLAEQNPDSAIRDFEAIDALAQAAGFVLQEDNAMPANNRLLVWRSGATAA